MGQGLAAALVVGLMIVFSGCVESGTPSSTGSTTSDAPTPTADLETGAIAGTVASDELLPVASARVSLLERDIFATTDAQGRFTLNGIEPGQYRLFVEKLGYESAGLKTEVRAGEVTEVKITIKPLLIAEEPYHISLPKVAQMHFAVTLMNTLQNHSAVNSLSCDPCKFSLHFPKGTVSVLSEAKWTTTGQPAVNSGLNVHHYREFKSGSYSSDACHLQPNSQPYKRMWSETCVGNVKKLDHVLLVIQPGPVPGLVAVENKVETWTTFAYVAELPEEFSAMSS